MSKKALVKQLQKELARLENELRNLTSLAASGDSASALKEKEMLIEKMEKEIRELTQQRDLARSRAEDLIHTGEAYQIPRSWDDNYEKRSWADEYSASEASEIIDTTRSDVAHLIYLTNAKALTPTSVKNHSLRMLKCNFCRMTPPRDYILINILVLIHVKVGRRLLKKLMRISKITARKSNVLNCLPLLMEITIQDNLLVHPMKEISDLGCAIPRSKSCTQLPLPMQKSQSSEFTEENESTSPDEFEKESPKRQDDNHGKLSKIEPTAMMKIYAEKTWRSQPFEDLEAEKTLKEPEKTKDDGSKKD
ncbi:unnamed protein product [Fraxinus pennsylvanica]|uniref:Uncharacterized protein n=1 Tax=Fraxinus pennsylvanica TaxID=56036 RepID=A0AAD2DUF6_9LAMI|nr:unnamed protein product [Fraxinus pennsylvanica]